jgi:hypothetical protein
MTESMRWEITITVRQNRCVRFTEASPAKRDWPPPIGVSDGDDFSLGIDYHERTNVGRKLVDGV